MDGMPEMQEQFPAMSMDGRYAGLSRPSMASEALGLLPGGNAGAISGARSSPPLQGEGWVGMVSMYIWSFSHRRNFRRLPWMA